MKKIILSSLLISCMAITQAQIYPVNYVLSVKSPGNPAQQYAVQGAEGDLALNNAPVNITQKMVNVSGSNELTITVRANQDAYINLSGSIDLNGFNYEQTQFYLPGFWYRKNLRSPDKAPNARVSKSWIVREDRLSTPLAGAYNETSGKGVNLVRFDQIDEVALAPLNQGEVILSGPTNLGAIGFQETSNKVALTFAIPYKEAPHSYYRKLTLGEPVTSFIKLNAGETVTYKYLIRSYDSKDFSDFVAQSWNTSFDVKSPSNVDSDDFTDEDIKKTLSQFWKQSFVTNSDGLKGYSGVHLSTEKCEVLPLLEVGFVGRVLLNAFNSLEFGYEQNDQQLIDMSQEIWDSYLAHGFTKGGLFRERIEENHNWETDVFSIRRQSEGLYAALFYLNYEKSAGRKHPEWETTVKSMFDLFVKLQKADGSFPRKFDDNLVVKDASG